MAPRPVHLTLDNAPPADVPLRFLLTAPWFGVAAMVAAGLAGPGIVTDRWSPEALAVAHLLVLGYVTMTIFGAQLQLMAVVAGASIPRPRASAAPLHAALALGTLGLAGGLATGEGEVIVVGAGLLALAFGGFVVVAVRALMASRVRHPAVAGMRESLVGLVVTIAVGLALAAGHAQPGHGLSRALTDVHLVWGLVGWMGVLVTAVAMQVVPMLQVTPPYPAILAQAIGPVVLASLVAWSAGVVLDAGWSAWPAMVAAAALMVFAVATAGLLVRQRRSEPDISLAYWWLAVVALLAAAAGWIGLVGLGLAPDPGRAAIAVTLVYLIGFLLTVIGGMVNRIVPFVVWLDLQRRRGWPTPVERRSPVPNVAALIPAARARWAFALHAAGVTVLAAVPWWPGTLLYPAAALLGAGWLLLWLNLVGAVRKGKAAAN